MSDSTTVKPFKCPDCDFTHASPQGIGAHRRRQHPKNQAPRTPTVKRRKRKQSTPPQAATGKTRIDSAIDNLADALADDIEARVGEKIMDRIAEKLEAARARRLEKIRERALAHKAINEA